MAERRVNFPDAQPLPNSMKENIENKKQAETSQELNLKKNEIEVNCNLLKHIFVIMYTFPWTRNFSV